MKRVLFTIVVLIFLMSSVFLYASTKKVAVSPSPLWSFQSIDTMKFSRDVSREKLNDSAFDRTIANQVGAIADMGATHIGIATPYDDEFLPMLNRWVGVARQHGLKVWFRGNWSGWEGWFEYPKIDRQTHIEKTREFILNHPELFKDGDVFSACPECENGGPGDPRINGDAKGHRQFLIDEYTVTKDAFEQIGKDVTVNYNSMNGDVARLIMDKETTEALGGLVVIDHYVRTPEQLAKDIRDIAVASGGKVVLGEFGAPIGDIHGQMSEDEQEAWIREAMTKLVGTPELIGLSYWVNVGGSTSLFNEDGTPRKAVGTLTEFFNPMFKTIVVQDPVGGVVENVTVTTLNREFASQSHKVQIPVIGSGQRLSIASEGYKPRNVSVAGDGELDVVLDPTSENFLYKVRKFFKFLFRF